MAIIERKWQEAEHEELIELIRWLQNNLNLRDWEITLDTNDNAPSTLKELETENGYNTHGGIRVWDDYLKALIWIPLGRLRLKNVNPYDAVCHEMIHIITVGLIKLEDRDSEIITYRLEDILYRLNCLETRREIAERK